jgi:hypothetical protein
MMSPKIRNFSTLSPPLSHWLCHYTYLLGHTVPDIDGSLVTSLINVPEKKSVAKVMIQDAEYKFSRAFEAP